MKIAAIETGRRRAAGRDETSRAKKPTADFERAQPCILGAMKRLQALVDRETEAGWIGRLEAAMQKTRRLQNAMTAEGRRSFVLLGESAGRVAKGEMGDAVQRQFWEGLDASLAFAITAGELAICHLECIDLLETLHRRGLVREGTFAWEVEMGLREAFWIEEDGRMDFDSRMEVLGRMRKLAELDGRIAMERVDEVARVLEAGEFWEQYAEVVALNEDARKPRTIH